MPARLVDRRPEVAAASLIAGLVPPPLFAGVRFDSYRPDPAEPSQAAALTAVRGSASTVTASPASAGRRGMFRGGMFWAGPSGRGRTRTPDGAGPTGIYLDGGFGVGKTHLLASLWHVVPGPKAYATFAELTQLAGALGFARLVRELSSMRLLTIDEFELDDPGDTVLVSSLLAGGYRPKYRRAISRLVALARLADLAT